MPVLFQWLGGNTLPLLLLTACCGVKNTAAPSEVVLPANMPPSQCLVSATIVKVDTSLLREDPQNICAKYPCRAKVLVNKLYGCGSGTFELPEEGKEIDVYFEFSLHATKGILPGMNTDYPGLEKGASFTAAVTQHQAPGGVSYTVSDYKKNQPKK